MFCLVVYVLFLLTAAALAPPYPEDPESWLIEAGVLVAGSVLVAHVFSCESFGSGGGLFAQVLSRAFPFGFALTASLLTLLASIVQRGNLLL